MITLTDRICQHTTVLARASAFEQGFDYGYWGGTLDDNAKAPWMWYRNLFGFTAWAPLMTPPSANMKLDKTIAYGLTIQSAHTRLLNGEWVNACPNVGHCGKVCVLKNGNGAYPTVQRARDAKTEFLAREPLTFLWMLGYELGKASRKHGHILYRPDVNSDLDWEQILGNVYATAEAFTTYGYSKRPEVLDGTPLASNYTIAYSLNETTDMSTNGLARLQRWLDQGGNIAVVTDDKKGTPVTQFAATLGLVASVVDADATDSWMLDHHGVLGRLTAKGKARALIGKSDFVRRTADTQVTVTRKVLTNA